MLKQSCKKIIIVAPSWIGDMVMAQSLFKILKHKNPEAIIDVLAHPYLSELIECMPEVNQVIISPFKHGEFNLYRRFILANKLKTASYDWAIILPNSLKSAIIPCLAKIPKRIGWRGEMRYFLLNDLRMLDKNRFPLMVQRFIALGLPKNAVIPDDFSKPHLEPNKANVIKVLQKFSLIISEKPSLALCIGAEYGEAKRWPPQYFAKLAQIQLKAGWEVWLIGGANDFSIATEIMQQCDGIKNFTGKTTLSEAIVLLYLSSLVVTNDSGLMHIAAALSKPLIAIYGSSSPSFTPPLNNKAKIVSLNLPCGPCFKRTCPLGHFKCMLELKPQKIAGTINELIKTPQTTNDY